MGRIGRSIKRAVSVSLVVGRPSRLMKPPGNLPAAQVRFHLLHCGARISSDYDDEDHRFCRVNSIAHSFCLAGLILEPNSNILFWEVKLYYSAAPNFYQFQEKIEF